MPLPLLQQEVIGALTNWGPRGEGEWKTALGQAVKTCKQRGFVDEALKQTWRYTITLGVRGSWLLVGQWCRHQPGWTEIGRPFDLSPPIYPLQLGLLEGEEQKQETIQTIDPVVKKFLACLVDNAKKKGIN